MVTNRFLNSLVICGTFTLTVNVGDVWEVGEEFGRDISRINKKFKS